MTFLLERRNLNLDRDFQPSVWEKPSMLESFANERGSAGYLTSARGYGALFAQQYMEQMKQIEPQVRLLTGKAPTTYEPSAVIPSFTYFADSFEGKGGTMPSIFAPEFEKADKEYTALREKNPDFRYQTMQEIWQKTKQLS